MIYFECNSISDSKQGELEARPTIERASVTKEAGFRAFRPPQIQEVRFLKKTMKTDLSLLETAKGSAITEWDFCISENVSRQVDCCSVFNVDLLLTDPGRDHLFNSKSELHKKNCPEQSGLELCSKMGDKYSIISRPRPRKSKLVALKKLNSLLGKLFLNQNIQINDFDLRVLELHILAEILIRKNKIASISR